MAQSPRYQQIKSYLLERIHTRQWPPGHKIPTEMALSDQFSVSRMTANKAITELVKEGFLERTPRLGTFVCNKKAESPLMEIRNIAEEVKNRGHRYSSEVISQSTIHATEDIALRLGVRQGTEVYFTQIVHFENNIPIQLEERWVNPRHAPSYIQQDFTGQTPNEYLVKTCPLSDIEHTVEALLPPQHVADLLNVSPQAPCLLLNRRTWSNQHLISTALLYHPGNKYKLSSRTQVGI
ncbi:histidine utilization repressor [Photobacterium gaetbulicola]|uniref:Histidine utilization repressor n=1 Tax=Photobacterium gaetbulicola Gung47 TaxID=658445 RepID=A0A0C5WPW8_9GAMM|nr:histidine utilization repressor [Photobacterium gaetbulicola]AJR08387.1 putative histidine utilization repressor [Photobacterium gaetbulicola Gung47]PSU12102.1 histidine utilization repressor [Photobacterium gaetbulicola]